ncbi:SulP family inorganic anion transporter [Klebsiella pneumoniae]|uniref:SulP family inorganic anion transporter n=1 Tax=Klebsiella pneumoniae TaxID=573 RepID=A0A927DY79_KLEPN|nr:SulP family inorganic anion transporter [Klebsiella pneumoniae]
MNTLRQDSLAGIVVFLVALPLCLGIAQASGLPPFVGLLTGIIGGLVVTALSPSRFAVSGPAAGLVTIVVAAIESLGFLLPLPDGAGAGRRAAAAVRHPAGRALYLAGSRQRHQRHAGGDRHPADYSADPRRARQRRRDRAR